MTTVEKSRASAWRSMLREATAVLAAILIAFALDAWWDGQVERRDAVAALENLEAELAANIAALDSTVVRDLEIVEVTRRLPGMSAAEIAARSAAELAGDLGAFGGFLALQPEVGALNALLNSGALLALRDEGLRSEISGLPQAWDEVEEDGAIATGLWVDAAGAMVRAAGPEVMLDVAFEGGSEPRRAALRAFVESEEFLEAAGVAAIFTGIYVSELQGMRGTLVSLSERVRNELGR